MNDLGISNLFNRFSLYIALLAAWIAVLGSLYFSEVLSYLPCQMCWYQRILMYPLAGIIAVGLLRIDTNLPYFILPFSLIGQGFSTYHYLIQKTNLFGAPAACRSGIPCTTIWINWFGFITIPFLAMVAFFVITMMALIALTAGEPDYRTGKSAPWAGVIGTIVIVFAGFAILYQSTAAQAQASFTVTELTGGAQTLIPTSTPPTADTAQASQDEQGAQLYAQACAVCHGAEAQGEADLGPSLVDSAIIQQSDAEVLHYIRSGVSVDDPRNTTGYVMPPSGGRPDLTDEEMLSIVHYLRTR